MESACKQLHTPQEIYNRVKVFIAKLKLSKNTATALLACMVGISPLQSRAQSDNSQAIAGDTIKEVVVTGTRNATDMRLLPMRVSVINRQTIEQTMQPSLLPILSMQVPGLFTTARGIMGYGVSDGAAGGISLRGLSGSSGQLMVLIDGHPQYMGLMGHPIADAYQTMLAEKIEVVRGPASMLKRHGRRYQYCNPTHAGRGGKHSHSRRIRLIQYTGNRSYQPCTQGTFYQRRKRIV